MIDLLGARMTLRSTRRRGAALALAAALTTLAGCGGGQAAEIRTGAGSVVDASSGDDVWTEDEARTALLDQLYVCDDGIEETMAMDINGIEQVTVAGFSNGYQYISSDSSVLAEQMTSLGIDPAIIEQMVNGTAVELIVGDGRVWIQFGGGDPAWYTTPLTDAVRAGLGIAATCDLEAGIDTLYQSMGIADYVDDIDMVGAFERMPVEIDPDDPLHLVARYGEQALIAFEESGLFTRRDLAQIEAVVGDMEFDVRFDDNGRLITRVMEMSGGGVSMVVTTERSFDAPEVSPPSDTVELSGDDLLARVFDQSTLYTG